ncbi:uncharacterized protein LOC103511458 isoform X2 [Diaphorina citri]|uniref:Uncharacterized protein LOC103511458 isoform X1 n=1 Tax=Diaphorina citri TaxID=121845 RepID=A0A1S3D4R5_DIACI|nr:uncharacterized protein LOC103511458 isoform X2 [Diaphorina citri]XP_026681020.1 uncharacterized protein LOC103511458 isoform X1 [Diaphorina citri]XP_026681021.1 uncharacterized protein LOC103511458 isoform X2 [Diaphorina citri]
MGSDNKGDLKEEMDKETTEKIADADNENKRVINTENVTDKKKKRKKKSTSENDSKDIKGDKNLGNSDKKNDERSNEDKEKCKKKDTGGGDGGGLMCEEKTEESGLDKDSGDENTDDFKLNKIKKCRVKLPMKGERFRVKFVDNFNVPHKLLLKNTDKVAKRKLNMLLAKKQLEPLNSMPMSRLKEKCHVLIKFRKPAKLIRAQVKWIQSEDKIEVQDIDSGTLYLVTKNDIFVLDDELIANIYPRVFICNLSEFDGKNIYWNPMIRDLYISTLRSGQISIEIRTFHHTVQSYDVHLKLYLDEKKFINLNEWLANSFIPYLVYLKTSVPSPVAQQVAKYPTEIFFPYVKLLKE